MAATILQNTAFPSGSAASKSTEVRLGESTPFQRLGFFFLLVFLFLAFSRVFDVKFSKLHITGASYRIVFAMTILSGAFRLALNNNIGRAMLGFTICFGISVPFSVWRGGSLPIFLDQWLLFSFCAFLATGGLTLTYAQTRKAIDVLAWALLTFVIIANVFGTTETGRLVLAQGKLANPNEMAQVLLIGIPLWIAKMSESKIQFQKIFAGGVMLVMLMTVVRTGSRGAMVAFVVLMLCVFLRAPVMGKAQMLLASIFFLGLVVVVMPGSLISRYKTISSDEVDDEEMDEAMRSSALSSSQSRKQLLKTSIKFTLSHPLFGVGPMMFAVADNAYAQSQGLKKGSWLGTHNSYTQVSSELGIPAFCFFVAIIFMATKGPYQLYCRTRGDPRTEDIGSIALGLHYAMVVYAVTVLFEHIAYSVMLPVFAGLAVALMRTAEIEVKQRLALPMPQNITAPMFRTYSKAPKRTVSHG
jgi:O-antigen ligase